METKFIISHSVRGCATLFVVPEDTIDEFLTDIRSDNLKVFDNLDMVRPFVDNHDLDISQVEFWPSKQERFLFTV